MTIPLFPTHGPDGEPITSCDVELLRKQLADAVEEVRRLTPSPSDGLKGVGAIYSVSGGGGAGGPTGPFYTAYVPERDIVLHGEEARQFIEALHARGSQPELVRILSKPAVAHEWGEPDIDWWATRTCKRCGVVQKYDHGPNNGPTTYIVNGREGKEDPGCVDAPKGGADGSL